jgi:hypothetical protein
MKRTGASYAADTEDIHAYSWVREFLEDGNEAVRLNGLAVLRNILDGPLGDEELATARGLLTIAESDNNGSLRERAVQTRQYSVLDR